jgi:hypothetical protein
LRPLFLTATLSLLAALTTSAIAQPAQDAGLPVVSTLSPAQGTLTPEQLQHLVAPVALYPDQVLTDILAAATYPAQVVEAQRFVADPTHAGLGGAALAEAAAGQDWDPSVKALLVFPQVLQMMDANLDWTEHLGRAFIAQQADVMSAVQQLRLSAEQSGTLASGPYASVVNEGGDIAIEPTSQQDIYLPSYQPDCVFGPNPACDGLDTELGWYGGIFLPYGYPQWGFVDWPRRAIRLDRPGHGGSDRPGTEWRHANLHVASGRSLAGDAGRFNYAPAANMPLAFARGVVRQTVPARRIQPGARVSAAPAFRQPPQSAPRAAPRLGHR